MMRPAALSLILGTVLVAAAPVDARPLTYRVALSGTSAMAKTGSPATGIARVRVDPRRQRVSVDLAVTGLKMSHLWDKLVHQPAGPIHFHEYPAGGGDAVLVLPLPYGATYRATPTGFRVTMHDYDYAAGAKVLGSSLTFADFVKAMNSGRVVLNIHTNRFEGGEISGPVVAG